MGLSEVENELVSSVLLLCEPRGGGPLRLTAPVIDITSVRFSVLSWSLRRILADVRTGDTKLLLQ